MAPKRMPLAAGTYTIGSGYRSAARPDHRGVDFAAPLGTPIYAPVDMLIIQGADRKPGTVDGFGVYGLPGMYSGSMTAEWKTTPELEGHYEVSDDGQVRSLTRIMEHPVNGWKTYRGKVLSQQWNKRNERFYVDLRLPGSRRMRPVHLLVTEAFHGPRPSPELQARHLNGNSRDNRAENLAWGTASENELDKVRHGTHQFAKRDACSRGHKYTPENTKYRERTNPRTGHVTRARVCVECERTANRESARRRRSKS